MSSSTVQDRKAPSSGTKVDLGQDAPVTREAAGHVADESLAAESYQEGGEFANNRNAQPDSQSSSGQKSSSGSADSYDNQQTSSDRSSNDRPSKNTRSQNTSSSNTSSTSAMPNTTSNSNTDRSSEQPHKPDVDTAPSYVQDNYLTDTKGPHGKNIHESDLNDDRYEDGVQKAFNSEPGSENDPSRLAERQFERDSTVPSGGAGPRQGELTNETQFDTLDRDVTA